MQKTGIFFAGAWILAAPSTLIPAEAESGKTGFEGVIAARTVSGKQVIEYRYTSSDSKLRLEDTRQSPPTPPYNLIDLVSGDVTILYPQNSTYVVVPAARFVAPGTGQPLMAAMPALPPGIGPQVMPGVQIPPAPAAKTGDKKDAPATSKIAVPAPPALNLPEGVTLPPGIGPQAKTPGANPNNTVPAIPLPEGVTLPPGIGPQAVTPGANPSNTVQPGAAAAGAPAVPAIPLPEGVKLPPGIGPQAVTPGANPSNTVQPGAAGTGVPAVPAIPLPEGVKLPPGIGPQANAASSANSQVPAMPGGLPGFPGGAGGGIPQVPQIQQQQMPAMPQMPQMPQMPAMPAMPGVAGPKTPPGLVKTKETKEILGYPCTRYTLTDPREGTLEVWATDQLGPFHLLASSAPRARGRRDFHETWPAHLRAKGLFPLLAVITEEETESYRFEVTAVEKDVPPPPGELFAVPPDFHQTELLDF